MLPQIPIVVKGRKDPDHENALRKERETTQEDIHLLVTLDVKAMKEGGIVKEATSEKEYDQDPQKE